MGKKDKILERARKKTQGLSFDDFESLLFLCKWEFKRQRGSHRFWYSPNKYRISIQPMKDGKAKAVLSSNNFWRHTIENMNRPQDYDWDGYTIDLYRDDDGDWLARLVDLPNVLAFGDTTERALDELYEAWEGMKEYYREDGENIPIAPRRKKYSSTL